MQVRNKQLGREVEAAESARDNALRLRDMLVGERDELSLRLAEALGQAKVGLPACRLLCAKACATCGARRPHMGPLRQYG